ncbi:hypothetical protein BDN72DRAFT_962834 [Pluteus cervinus]|uniref:Uncharacterized protein n=1 Tax=Pluteus cervinus TaxID=181527 RepID=A0ACD3AH89_9AGAR|nr:hypothetical protein BDN72DRAFT_962834 [Pluteus cervinus]
MVDPIFPLEIENKIFVYAVLLKNQNESALNLLLVARRVHTWLMPELLRTLIIRTVPITNQYPFRWQISTLEKYGKHVRNLFIWWSRRQVEDLNPDKCLSLCPNVTNLLLWTERKDVPVDKMVHLPLTHLSFNLDDTPEMTPEIIQLYSRITHLETISTTTTEEKLAQLKHFTSITHLAVPNTSRFDILPRFFTNRPTLEVLIFLDPGSSYKDPLRLDGVFDPKSDDPRIVRMTCQPDCEVEEWLLNIQMGRGMWEMAEGAVREQKKLRDAVQRR